MSTPKSLTSQLDIRQKRDTVTPVIRKLRMNPNQRLLTNSVYRTYVKLRISILYVFHLPITLLLASSLCTCITPLISPQSCVQLITYIPYMNFHFHSLLGLSTHIHSFINPLTFGNDFCISVYLLSHRELYCSSLSHLSIQDVHQGLRFRSSFLFVASLNCSKSRRRE